MCMHSCGHRGAATCHLHSHHSAQMLEGHTWVPYVRREQACYLVSVVGLFLCQRQCAELVRCGIKQCEVLVVQPKGFTQATDVLQQSLQVSDDLLRV